MMKRLGTSFLLWFLVAWSPVLVHADGRGPTISAPSVTVGVGDTFTVPISISGAADLTSWQFDLMFNPAIVTANSVTEGPFMSSFGGTLFSPGVIDNTSGLISLVTDSYIDLPPDPSGSGDLADISFTALAPGVSTLTLQNVFLNLSDEGFDVTNGEATVPEPTTLLMLASGMALMGIRRSGRGIYHAMRSREGLHGPCKDFVQGSLRPLHPGKNN